MVLEAVQRRLDLNPGAMRQRREVVEHPFGTIKMRMGATHFLLKTLPKVTCEMALPVLAYNLTRVLNILGIQPLMATLRHRGRAVPASSSPTGTGHPLLRRLVSRSGACQRSCGHR